MMGAFIADGVWIATGRPARAPYYPAVPGVEGIASMIMRRQVRDQYCRDDNDSGLK